MIDEALDMIGVDGNTIDAILITHEHIDISPARVCCAGSIKSLSMPPK